MKIFVNVGTPYCRDKEHDPNRLGNIEPNLWTISSKIFLHSSQSMNYLFTPSSYIQHRLEDVRG